MGTKLKTATNAVMILGLGYVAVTSVWQCAAEIYNDRHEQARMRAVERFTRESPEFRKLREDGYVIRTLRTNPPPYFNFRARMDNDIKTHDAERQGFDCLKNNMKVDTQRIPIIVDGKEAAIGVATKCLLRH